MVVLHHGASIDKTRAALTEAAMRVPGCLPEKPEIVLVEMTASGVTWQVQVWSQSADFIAVRQATMREVKVALDAADISFAVAPPVDVKR
jgi:small-conductance mechanosensitive channel